MGVYVYLHIAGAGGPVARKDREAPSRPANGRQGRGRAAAGPGGGTGTGAMYVYMHLTRDGS